MLELRWKWEDKHHDPMDVFIEMIPVPCDGTKRPKISLSLRVRKWGKEVIQRFTVTGKPGNFQKRGILLRQCGFCI